MCTTLPPVLVSILGIEKLLPRFSDLEVFLQLLPRSSTGERMNPYTSLWTGVTDGDGPQELHVVLLDNGRTRVLADEVGRQALHCIRCSACLNVCPVYSRTGGHAYGSVYPGPIGAILMPQLEGSRTHASLPYASSLCGACYEVCPVKIDIPTGARCTCGSGRSTTVGGSSERTMMGLAAWAFLSPRRFALAQRVMRMLARARTAARGDPQAAAPARGVDRDTRPAAGRAGELPGVVGEAAMSAQRTRSSPGLRRRSAGAAPVPDVDRAYRRSGELSDAERLDRFCERVGEYRAEVRRLDGSIAAAVESVCAERNIASLVVPPGLPDAWRPRSVLLVEDDGLEPRALDELGGALTGCTAAVAETGTIILTAAPHEGRRAITLVPDLHICVVRETQVVRAAARGARRPLPRGPRAPADHVRLGTVRHLRHRAQPGRRRPRPPTAVRPRREGATVTQRSAFVLHVKPDKIDEYVAEHAKVWPEMLQALRGAGIRNYSIFRAGTDVFGYFEADDLERAGAHMAAQDVSARWQDHMAALLDERVPDAGPPPLEEIFRLD